MKSFFSLCTTLALAVFLTGCSTVSSLNPWAEKESMGVSQYNPGAVQSLMRGRDYAQQGRFELAREQYLLALASSGSGEIRQVISHELAAVDMMIQTQR